MNKKIAILTSGGDAPGMNAAIRAVTRAALQEGWEVFAIYNGYKGLIDGELYKFSRKDVSEILYRGGTILGTARLPEFVDPNVRQKGIENLKKYGIDTLIVLGGDGTYHGAQKLVEMGINCIGIPCTIDNDIVGTDFTIGFDTALNTIVNAVDKIRDTSSSHQRCTIVEIMGRYCGDLALWAGICCGAEYVIIPEKEFDRQELLDNLKTHHDQGRRHAIVLITEKITDVEELARDTEEYTEFETRATVLGYIQRGGSPSGADRVLASRMGAYAVELIKQGKEGRCVGIIDNQLTSTDFVEALNGKKRQTNDNLYNVFFKIR
jgi:6-phosphofructokinase 1